MNGLTFTRGDVDVASRVLTASAENLVGRGQELWTPQSLTPERLNRHYPQGGWRVAWRGGEAVGCFVLLDHDPLFWPGAPEGEALYLHKLGVHPAAQGQGLGAALLREAARETATRGRGRLRLDTATARPRLRAVYERFGFRHVGDRVVKQWAVSLYEYPVGRSASDKEAQ